MASYGLSAQSDHVRSTVAEAKNLTVERLKKVLKSENLQVSGIKSELQSRLIHHIEKCAASGEYDRVSRVRNAIRSVVGSYPNPYPSPYSTNTPTASLSPQFDSPTPRPPPPITSFPMPTYTQNRTSFKKSPFYTITRPLALAHELKAREHTRDTARVNVVLDQNTVDLLQRDSNTRIMVFCAVETFDSRHLPCDISFPQHGELKCNSDDVKANLKGLKNKSGTTRPADVTHLIRKKVGFPNSIELVYALTTKEFCTSQKYYLIVNLVQKVPVENLLSELRRGKFISRGRVIQESKSASSLSDSHWLTSLVQTAALDPEIVATSSVMSLKDPVQMTRIQTPCRSMACKHNECFDAAAYLHLQEQAPTWTCPCCNKSAPWETLIFDQYFDDILKSVSPDVDQVTVEPDGRWHIGESQNTGNGHGRDGDSEDDYNDDDDDDDIVFISDAQRSSAKEPFRASGLNRTPPTAGPSSFASQSSNKRKHAETIDLTADDSDDDEPPRPPQPKRSSTSTSFPLISQHQSPTLTNAAFRIHMPPPPPNSSSNTYYQNPYFAG